MVKDFGELRDMLRERKMPFVAVAAAHDKAVIETVKLAAGEKIAHFVLVGDKIKIEGICEEIGCKIPQIIDEKDDIRAVARCVTLIKEGQADVLMKGLLTSSQFLKGILNKEEGLEYSGRLCHLAAFQIVGGERLAFFADGGMNMYPSLEQKVEILNLSVSAIKKIGYENVNVGVLCASEVPNEKSKSSMDAFNMQKMWENGEIKGCTLEGPISFDVAFSLEAAKHKGIKSHISGKTDLYIVPDIDSGNLIGKALIYGGKAKMAGVILGCSVPIVMTSRAEDAEGKLNSILLACAVGGKK